MPFLAAALALALAVSGCAPGQSGVASTDGGCAAPFVEAPDTLTRGEPVTVEGEAFVMGCNDTGEGEPPASWRSVDVFLARGADEVLLGTASVTDGVFRAEMTVPADAPTGEVTLGYRATGANPKHIPLHESGTVTVE